MTQDFDHSPMRLGNDVTIWILIDGNPGRGIQYVRMNCNALWETKWVDTFDTFEEARRFVRIMRDYLVRFGDHMDPDNLKTELTNVYTTSRRVYDAGYDRMPEYAPEEVWGEALEGIGDNE